MEQDPVKNDARKSRRNRVLRPVTACALCGTCDPTALMRVTRTIVEQHHAVGRANDESLTVPLCRNCHAGVTEDYRAAGVSMDKPRTLLDKLCAILTALGVFFERLGEKLLEWASALAGFMLWLDASFPDWRTHAGVA